MAKDDLRPDIAAARKRMGTKWGGGREIKHLVTHLWEGAIGRAHTNVDGAGKPLAVEPPSRCPQDGDVCPPAPPVRIRWGVVADLVDQRPEPIAVRPELPT